MGTLLLWTSKSWARTTTTIIFKYCCFVSDGRCVSARFLFVLQSHLYFICYSFLQALSNHCDCNNFVYEVANTTQGRMIPHKIIHPFNFIFNRLLHCENISAFEKYVEVSKNRLVYLCNLQISHIIIFYAGWPVLWSCPMHDWVCYHWWCIARSSMSLSTCKLCSNTIAWCV